MSRPSVRLPGRRAGAWARRDVVGSSIGWLDYSEHERRKALDVVALFREQDTVDELGIGVIRDFVADQLFPGTSTIQTQARYFLFVPWMYRDLERRRVGSAEVKAKARREEFNLIEGLIAGGEREGVIGVQARRTLKRLPSNVYWRGVGEWGIRLYQGSQEQYQRSLDTFHGRRQPPRADGDASDVVALQANWHPNLPPPPPEFPKIATLKLSREEAIYLRERVLATKGDSLLAHLLREEVLPDAKYPWWEHAAAGWSGLDLLEHAQSFSEAMHGAALLYNLLVAELVPNEEWIETYRGHLSTWASTMHAGRARFDAWDRTEFWRVLAEARVRFPTKTFIDAWLDVAAHGEVGGVADDAHARRLIRNREEALKRGRSRIASAKARGLWGGASGTAQLDYRWPISKTIISDIVTGLVPDA